MGGWFVFGLCAMTMLRALLVWMSLLGASEGTPHPAIRPPALVLALGSPSDSSSSSFCHCVAKRLRLVRTTRAPQISGRNCAATFVDERDAPRASRCLWPLPTVGERLGRAAA